MASAHAGMATGKSTGNLPAKRECNIPGKHAWVLWNTPFEIDQRYVPIKAIGKGAYGVVCSAKDQISGDKVAIKKITNAFDNLTDARRTLREMKLLRHLKHENIIALRNILRPPSRDGFNDVYLVSCGPRSCARGTVVLAVAGAASRRAGQLVDTEGSHNGCLAPGVRPHGHRSSPDYPVLSAAN